MRLMRLEPVDFLKKEPPDEGVAIVMVGTSLQLSIVCNRHHLKEKKRVISEKKNVTVAQMSFGTRSHTYPSSSPFLPSKPVASLPKRRNKSLLGVDCSIQGL